ncbi:MAG: LysM peptidoglycan-binding domain-containing protein, partial [Parvibaculaceae bacterium]
KAPEPAIAEKAPEPAEGATTDQGTVVAEKAPEPAVEQKTEQPAAAEKKTEEPTEQVVASAPEPEQAKTEKAPEPAVEAKTEQPAAVEKKTQESTEQVIASAPEPEKVQSEKAKPVPLSLDVVDYNDKGDIIFSGRAEPGTAVRLYVDNGLVGDAIVTSSSRWSFAGSEQIAPGTHQLRADQIDSKGKVLSRVELPFQREKPEAVAALEQPEPKPEAKAAGEEQVAVAEPDQSQPSAAIEQPVEEQSEAAPAKPELAPDVAAKADGQSGVAGEAAAKPRAGRVVIQPGNNLWKLSRVIYGRGVNYSVIYAANQEQIRNPDLIYPGQIFAIPNAEPPEKIDPKRKEPLTSAEGGTALE